MHQGILRRLKSRLDRNRLGEVLVQNGLLTANDLKSALELQRKECVPLGTVLIEHKYVTSFSLRRALFEQITFRVMAALIAIFISFSSFGPKQARAAQVKDLPQQITLVNSFHTAIAPLNYYPALFGSQEKRSSNLRPFTKWSSMFERLERTIKDRDSQTILSSWKENLSGFKDLPLPAMVQKINTYINQVKYVNDSSNWGRSDHWATPLEFFAHGGDCEDFAIAKYASLRALGVPEERLRLAIVHDREKNIPHAVLIVYTDRGAMMMDNQIKTAKPVNRVNRYRPIFSINRTAWWLHSKPQGRSIRVASAD